MPRKTFQVSDLKDRINRQLEVTADDMTAERSALAVTLESVLMDTGNYRGFAFTDGNEGDTDSTRRRYL